MERAEWLQQMRGKAEALYDHFAPFYWVKFGLYANGTHQQYLERFLARVGPRASLLSAACGAGRYDGMLLEAGHHVVGIDQSEGMLARARERFPKARYKRLGLQEMRFRETFDGATCIDAMEHVCPEDWPRILRGFWEALKPGGALYLTVCLADADELQEAYEQAMARGLPAVFGEVVDQVDEASRFLLSFEDVFEIPEEALGEYADRAVYHYYPPLERVRAWIGEVGLVIEEEGTGDEYAHFVVTRTEGTQPVRGD